MSTLLCQIEACLNSRPLTPLSSDPADVRALTPGRFIIGVPFLKIPDSNQASNLSLCSRWALLQKLKAGFWKRWSLDYLHYLQQRTKWQAKKENIKIGDLVLLQDSQAPPLQWRLGRVIRTYPGADQKVRVVGIKTQEGEVKRPIAKLSLLLPAAEDV